MTYQEYVLDTFKEELNGSGATIQKAERIINKQPFEKIESYLNNLGYDLKESWRLDFIRN